MRIVTKKSVLCCIFITLNLMYSVFIINELGIFSGQLEFRVLYAPGLVFSLLIFPCSCVFLRKIKEQFVWIDITFILIPLLLWLLAIPGGSFANFLFINYPLIWTVSLAYLFRFNNSIKGKNVYLTTLSLWILIALVSYSVVFFIPVLPE
jgi:hypothetical protein